MTSVDILLPTYNRLPSLIFTLSGLAGQTFRPFKVILADQSAEPVVQSPVVKTLIRILEASGREVEYHHRTNQQGIAEQRHFLLSRAQADLVLYLDDDVWMEPWVLEKCVEVITEQQCGFVGAFPTGLSHRADVRPQQQILQYWEGRVTPEALTPGSPEWERWQLHRAANLYHASQRIPEGETRLYKVSWIASCILYDRKKLEDVGGFTFWTRLPRFQSGEEVLVQNLMMRNWGGCAIAPSGTYYSEVPSTVLNEAGTVDAHALSLLDEMIERYCDPTANGAVPTPSVDPSQQTLPDF